MKNPLGLLIFFDFLFKYIDIEEIVAYNDFETKIVFKKVKNNYRNILFSGSILLCMILYYYLVNLPLLLYFPLITYFVDLVIKRKKINYINMYYNNIYFNMSFIDIFFVYTNLKYICDNL
jgi:hypothetical protein